MEELAERHDKLSSRKRKAGLGFEPTSRTSTTATRLQNDRPLDVANHYNNLVDRRRSLTSGSDILHVRNLHNWVKAVLIGKFTPRAACVLDLACGKGGDMLKFKAAAAAHYVGVDIAHESVRDAVARFNGVPPRPPMPFSADFLTADFCDEAWAPWQFLEHNRRSWTELHYQMEQLNGARIDQRTKVNIDGGSFWLSIS